MRRNMSGNLGLYKYLWPGSVYKSVQQISKLNLLYCGLYDQPRLRHFVRYNILRKTHSKFLNIIILWVLSTLVIGKGLNLSLIVPGSQS